MGNVLCGDGRGVENWENRKRFCLLRKNRWCYDETDTTVGFSASNRSIYILTIGFRKSRVVLRMLTSAAATQFPKRTVQRMQKYPAHAKVPPLRVKPGPAKPRVMLWPLTRVTHIIHKLFNIIRKFSFRSL